MDRQEVIDVFARQILKLNEAISGAMDSPRSQDRYIAQREGIVEVAVKLGILDEVGKRIDALEGE